MRRNKLWLLLVTLVIILPLTACTPGPAPVEATPTPRPVEATTTPIPLTETPMPIPPTLTSTSTPTSTPMPTSTPTPNMQAWREYGAAWRKMAYEWDDACAVAHSTARIALSGPVAELQRIRREWREIEPPEGLEEFHKDMIAFQDATIEGFLAFMDEKPEQEVATHFDSAHIYYMQAFDSTSDEYLAWVEVARPTPTPTLAPTPTPAMPAGWRDYDSGEEILGFRSFTVSYPVEWTITVEAFGVFWRSKENVGVHLNCSDTGPMEWSLLNEDNWDDDKARLEKLESLWTYPVIDSWVEQIDDYKCYIVLFDCPFIEVVGVLGELTYDPPFIRGTTFKFTARSTAGDVVCSGRDFHENELKTFWKLIESLKIK